MRRTASAWLTVLAALAIAPTPVLAQTPAPPDQGAPPRPARANALPRFSITVGGGGQVTSSDFTQRISFPLFAEDAEVTGPVTVGRPARVNVAFGVRAWSRLGVGVRVGYARGTGRQEATFSLPDPFQFATPHRVTGEAASRRTLLDVHLQVLLLAKRSGPWDVTIMVGPSFTTLRQELALNRFNYNYVFPFTSVTLDPITSGATKGEGFGANAGVSITRRWTRRIQFEGHVLGSTATADFDIGTGPFSVQAGGVQAGGGLRFVF